MKEMKNSKGTFLLDRRFYGFFYPQYKPMVILTEVLMLCLFTFIEHLTTDLFSLAWGWFLYLNCLNLLQSYGKGDEVFPGALLVSDIIRMASQLNIKLII